MSKYLRYICFIFVLAIILTSGAYLKTKVAEAEEECFCIGPRSSGFNITAPRADGTCFGSQTGPSCLADSGEVEDLKEMVDMLKRQVSALQDKDMELMTQVAALETKNMELMGQITELENGIVQDLVTCVSVDMNTVNGLVGPHVMVEGCNLHVRDGSDDTDGMTNGLGNLLVGYNEEPTNLQPGDREGSHNLIVGREHIYSNFGGFVAGLANKITGQESTVSGGSINEASGNFSSVSGGGLNFATNTSSSVSGGAQNRATGGNSSVSGGAFNEASGSSSSVSGGRMNTASLSSSSVAGGRGNIASGQESSVSGGFENEASAVWSSVAGGRSNTASAQQSGVGGGSSNTAGVINCWRTDTLNDGC